MEILVSAVVMIVLTVAFTFLVRTKDIPTTEALPPAHHLEERRSAIYENLRDLQFEYRVGKLSEADYQQTKLDLQKELAGVLAEMERVKGGTKAAATGAPGKGDPMNTCPHCGARFSSSMKFCGECGKAMS